MITYWIWQRIGRNYPSSTFFSKKMQTVQENLYLIAERYVESSLKRWRAFPMSEKSGLSFELMFEKATGHAPHRYQVRLANTHPLPAVWNLPTGSGKTAAAVLNWVWRTQYAANGEGVIALLGTT